MKLSASERGKHIKEKAKELAPVRKRAWALLDGNPTLTNRDLYEALTAEFGPLHIGGSTVPGWRTRWVAKQAHTVTPPAATIAWQMVLESVPDEATLGSLLIQGFVSSSLVKDEQIKSLQQELKEVTRSRKEVIQNYNALCGKGKTWGIDKAKKALIPKQTHERKG